MMSEDKAHILVIDDDERLRSLISRFLRENGMLVSGAASAAQARNKMRNIIFDLLILDVMMPKETGIQFAVELEKTETRPPILMLTALNKTSQRIQGLEAGADDYLAKPFDSKELLLRVQKLLSRTMVEIEQSIKIGSFTFKKNILMHNGSRVILSSSDEVLLKLLAKSSHKIISREEIAKICNLESVRAVDVRINRLRQKIELDPSTPVYLQTVRGVGYILRPE